jgi:hypothetical protein
MLKLSAILLALAIPLAGNMSATAATGTSSFTGDGNWGGGGMYAQGFSLGTGASGFGVTGATGSTAHLTQFQFYKSGLADAANVQLAIVSNYFIALDPTTHSFSSTDAAVVGLSSNTLNVTSANYAVGAPINFTFSNLPLTYGRGTYDQNGLPVFESPDYAAIFVNNNGGTLTPVFTPVLITNYTQVQDPPDGSLSDGSATGASAVGTNGDWTEYVPSHDYGYRRDYNDGTTQHFGDQFKAASNFFSTDNTSLSTFGPYYGDVDFTTTFTFTPKQGDFNGDGHFDSSDIAAMEQALINLSGFDSAHGLSPDDIKAMGDFNGDGVVNNTDLQGMLNALQSGQGSLAGVPEPGSLALSAWAAVAFVLYGRRVQKNRLQLPQVCQLSAER